MAQHPTSAAPQGRTSPPRALFLPEEREVAQETSEEPVAFSFLDPVRQKHAVPHWASLEGLVVGQEKDEAPVPRMASLPVRLGLAAVAGVPVLLAAQGALACLLP